MHQRLESTVHVDEVVPEVVVTLVLGRSVVDEHPPLDQQPIRTTQAAIAQDLELVGAAERSQKLQPSVVPVAIDVDRNVT